jgi:hypothetical protein
MDGEGQKRVRRQEWELLFRQLEKPAEKLENSPGIRGVTSDDKNHKARFPVVETRRGASRR